MSDETETGILSEGDVLNNTYVISSLIASGGTGEVYRAMNRVSGREIAIKILKREFAQNEQFIDLMKREASVLHEVIDPAVVRYYDVLESDLHGGFLFLVMEFISGHSLADEMKDRGPLDAGVLMQVARRVLQGLKAAHDKKAFHRDLSPDNIILRDGDPEQATLIDFGIAKDVNDGAKTVVGGGFAGKYQYASPEQMEGRVDQRSDLYSLGMTLVGAYRGQAPLHGSSMMEIVKAKAEKPDLSDMSGPLHDLVSHLVEPDPADRLQTADEALRFLGSAQAPGPGAGAMPAPGAEARMADPDRTVVAPRSLPPGAPAPAAAATPPGKGNAARPGPAGATARNRGGDPAAVPQGRKGRGGMVAGLVVLLLAGAGAGAYFGGLIPLGPQPPEPTAPDVPVAQTDPGQTAPATGQPPSESDLATGPATTTTATPDQPRTQSAELPLAVPYRLSIERTARDEPIRLIGNLPAADRLPALQSDLQSTFDSFAVLADVTPARGEPFDGWTDRVVALAALFTGFDSFTVAAEAGDVVLIANAANETEKNALLAAARQTIGGAGLTLVDRIAVAPPELTLATLAEAIKPFATCGDLRLSGGTGGVLGPADTIRVAGHVASAAEITRLSAYLAQAAPGRSLERQLDVINEGVCRILSILPAETSSVLDVAYSYGSRDDSVTGDTFRIGDNPVIDITLPADGEGYLHVAFIDVAEQVFHLLPHQAREGNFLPDIGTVSDGRRSVRVAFPIADASIEKLGFKVVEPLGTNIVLAIVTPDPLFADLRPRAESNGAFAEALLARLPRATEDGGLLTWRFLHTEK